MMNDNEVLSGIGKNIGGLLLAAVGEEYVDDSASADFEDDSALNTTGASRSRLSASCTIEASNDGDGDGGNATGLDTLSHMSNSFAEPQSLDGSGIAANNRGNINNGGGVVGTVATFIFSRLAEEESDHFSSFDDTNNISGTDIESSGIAEQNNLTSSYISEGSADDCNVSAESKVISDSIEHQGPKAASAALMLAQTGCNESNNASGEASGDVCDGEQEKEHARSAIARALPIDSSAAGPLPLKKSQVKADNALAEIKRAICEAKTRSPDVPLFGYNADASVKGDRTPEKSAWEKESLPPREDDLKYLEMRLKEAGHLDSSTTSADTPKPASSSTKNGETKNAATDYPSKRNTRIREKVLRLKETRKCSRYNGNYSRAALKSTACASAFSPAKSASKADIELTLSDDISPAKTADVTDDASFGLESSPANASGKEPVAI